MSSGFCLSFVSFFRLRRWSVPTFSTARAHCIALPLVVLRHVTAQGVPPARFSGATHQRRYSRISRDE